MKEQQTKDNVAITTITKMNYSLVAVGEKVLVNNVIKTVASVEQSDNRRQRKRMVVPKLTVRFVGEEKAYKFSWHDEVDVVVPVHEETDDPVLDEAL